MRFCEKGKIKTENFYCFTTFGSNNCWTMMATSERESESERDRYGGLFNSGKEREEWEGRNMTIK